MADKVGELDNPDIEARIPGPPRLELSATTPLIASRMASEATEDTPVVIEGSRKKFEAASRAPLMSSSKLKFSNPPEPELLVVVSSMRYLLRFFHFY